MSIKYVKIGGLGIVGVDKKQRTVKMRYLPVLGVKMVYTGITVFDVSR